MSPSALFHCGFAFRQSVSHDYQFPQALPPGMKRTTDQAVAEDSVLGHQPSLCNLEFYFECDLVYGIVFGWL